jgi:NHLM bacteriocin system ABC transporter ATP-binding protein
LSFVDRLPFNLIAIGGNRPLLLSSSKVWLVKKGKVDLFITEIVNDEAVGGRSYIFTAEKGEIFCGRDPIKVNARYFAMLAVGHSDTELQEFDWLQFTQTQDQKEYKEIISLLKSWVEKWQNEGIKKRDLFAWSKDLEAENIKEYSKQLFVQSLEEVFAAKREEILKNKAKQVQDNARMNMGLKMLAKTLDSKKRKIQEREEVYIDNLLFKACVEVGKARKITILPSHGLRKNNSESKDLLGDIARASQIRIRKIILKDKWWKEDNGPLLVYREADGQPLALLPISPTKYKLHDPADGSEVTVNRMIAETIKAEAYTFYRPLPAKAIGYKELLNYLADGIWKSDVFTVIAMGLLGGVLGALTPVVTGIIFDSVIPDGERLLLSQIGFLLIAIALTDFAFNLTRSFALHRIEGQAERDLQAAIWDRLLSLPVPFFKDYTAGELAGRAMGISQIRSILSGAAVNSIISGIFAIFYFILLFYYSWKLALIATVIVAVVMAISLLLGYLQIRYERQLIDMNNSLAGKIFGLLTGISKIKTTGSEKRAFHIWAVDFSRVREITYQKENLGNKMAVFNSTANIISTGIIFFSLMKVSGVNLGAGKFIAFNSAFSSYLGVMLEISAVFLQLNVIKPLYERVKPILETLPEFDQDKADPGELEGNIEVRHVNFRYQPEGPLILNDIVLEIKKGDYVGIVGTSGSGKSTLFRLLLGFEKAESGQIFYDQHDLENVDIRAIRRQLGVVLQSGQLMQGSIFDNIVAANPGLSLEDAWEAARMAGMEEDIKSMPMGMHTMVSEDGGTLSGGQRQRLLIARAIISRPKIIFFDEATSALDNRTQKIVSESLASLGATRVVIAHRLSTITNCNKIVVMDKGRITEQGSYQELFKNNGLFTQLVKRQLA